MRPRLIFGVFSATQQGATVTQLARSLMPHKVVVHHDFRKRADFAVSGPNVRMIPDPRDTGWGTWGFSDSIFHTLEHCVENFDFDYFHLMSPTCLPIRPIEEFEQRVARGEFDIHADLFPVDSTEETLMTFGYRTFVPGASLRYRMLSRARRWYFGSGASLMQKSSLSILSLPDSRRMGEPDLQMRAAVSLTKMAAHGWLGRTPFGANFRPMMGSTWIGMTREVVDYVLSMREDPRIMAFFRHLKIVDETLFSTILGNSPFRIGHANHIINDFTEAGNPRWIDESDFDRLVATERFFARKFPDDPSAPVRLMALKRAGIKLDEPQGVPQPA